MSSKKIFWFSIVLTTLLRVLLAIFIPITGDEAYYATWGLRPLQLGYFDHPPAVAFAFAFSFLFGVHSWTARLTGLLLPLVVSICSYSFISKEANSEKAYLWSSLILWLPICAFSVLIAPDTVLTLTVLISFLFYVQALQKQKIYLSILSGVFLGLSFLAKMLILPYVVFLVLSVIWMQPKNRFKNFRLLCIQFMSSLPFIGVWIYWNIYHCWSNYMLHGVNRHGDGRWGIEFPLQFIFFQVCIFTPFLIFFIIKDKVYFKEKWSEKKNLHWILIATLGPVCAFGLVALRFAPSLHWPLPYNILFIIFLGLFISDGSIRKCLKWMACFTSILVFLSLILLISSSYWIPKHHNGKTLEIFFKRDHFYSLVKPFYDKGYVLATDSYTLSSLLEFEFYNQKTPAPFAVLGSTSHFGRQDDVSTNYFELEGKNFAVFTRGLVVVDRYQQWFREVIVHSFQFNGFDYYIVEGLGFKFESYRETVLKEVIQNNYQFPSYLPVLGCPIIERHFHSPQM